MLNVDFSKAKELTAEHLRDLLEQIKLNNGLEYCPREQTPQGRQFEHASVLIPLIETLRKVVVDSTSDSSASKVDFEIVLVSDDVD